MDLTEYLPALLLIGYIVFIVVATIVSLWVLYLVIWRAVRRGIREYVLQRDRMDPMALPPRQF